MNTKHPKIAIHSINRLRTLALAFALGGSIAAAPLSAQMIPSHDCPTAFQSDWCQLEGNYAVGFDQAATDFKFLNGKGKVVTLPVPAAQEEAAIRSAFGNKKIYKSLTPDEINVLTALTLNWNQNQFYMGYETTASGLGYKMLANGTGKKPEAGKKVKVHYRGTLEDGSVFDSSFERGQPIEFTLGVGQVIKGWDEGIQLFPVGSKGVLRIPSNLGYGAFGAPPVIPPNATLYFEIEVVGAQ